MKPESRQVWSERVARWAESGLDALAFASKEGINAHTLKNWRWKLRVAARESSNEARGGFVEVIAVDGAAHRGVTVARGAQELTEPLELHLRCGLRVLVPSRFNAEALRRLVAALEVR